MTRGTCVTIFVVLQTLLVSQAAICGCVRATSTNRLQWSESAVVISPDHQWEIEADPNLGSNNNNTRVFAHNCKTGKQIDLFTLTRNAEVYWGPGSNRVLIINMPVANTGEILLFNVYNLSYEKSNRQLKQLDSMIKNSVTRELGSNRQIVFYLPSFASWDNNELILEIGGATTYGSAGPMTSYCYSAVINTATEQVEVVLPSRKPKKGADRVECKKFP